jgi:hypothetical protein
VFVLSYKTDGHVFVQGRAAIAVALKFILMLALTEELPVL